MPFFNFLYGSPTVVSADGTYFTLLSDDLLRRVWHARTCGGSVRSMDLFKARISHLTYEKSPFRHLVQDMFRTLNISMNMKPHVSGHTIVIGKVCSMDIVERVVYNVGGVIQTIHINGTLFRKDKQKCARFADLIVRRCTAVNSLVINWGEKEPSAYESSLCTILEGLGPRLESLSVTTSGRNHWGFVKVAGEACTSLKKLTYKGYGLPLFPEEQWVQLGRTLQYLDLSEAHMWEHALPMIVAHCRLLNSLHLNSAPLLASQAQELSNLYTSIADQIVDVSFVDMKAAMCRKVVEKCPFLARVSVIEDDPAFRRMQTIAHRLHDLELVVDDTADLEALSVATGNCSQLEHLRITYKRPHPGLLTTFFSDSKHRLETLCLDHGTAPLSRSAVNAISKATGSLRELTFVVRELQELDVLNALATSNRALEKVTVSFGLKDCMTEAALASEEHIHLAVAVARSFRHCTLLKEVIVEDRKIRTPTMSRIRGEIEEAFLSMHLRGVRVRVFGGYMGSRRSHRFLQ